MDLKKEPLISIIIPCYNSEKYIDRTLKSLIGQTYRNLQIVCVNDGSKDKTQQLIEEFVKTDSRIELYNKENGGIESALKQGLGLLKGDYTFMMGHDDTVSEDAFEKALEAYEKNPELDAVRLDLYFVFENPSKNVMMNDRRVLNGKDAFLETIGEWNIHTLCVWRTAIFKKINEVTSNGTLNFDELGTRYLYLNCRAVGYCEGVYNYFQTEQSATRHIGIKRLQALTTDTSIRDLLVNVNLYEPVSNTYEHYALGNLIKMGMMFFSMNHLSKKDRSYAIGLLKNAFSALNRNILLSSFSSAKRMVWQRLLSSFNLFLLYLKVRQVYYNGKVPDR